MYAIITSYWCMPRVAGESSLSKFSRHQLVGIVLGTWTKPTFHRFCARTRCNHLHLFVLCSVRTAREASSSAVYAVATLYILYCLWLSHPISCSPVMYPTKEPAHGVLFALPPPDMSVLNSTLGAILISGIVTSVLYGISCLQCFIFFQHSARKKFRILTYSIWSIWLLDTAHLAVLVSYTLYWYMVKNFSNVLALLELPWSVSGGLIITTVSDGIVRFWFTYRVWILSNNNKWLTIPLLVLNINLLGVALASGIKGLYLHTLAQFLELSWLLYYGFGLIIVTDFYIAISLCFFFYRSRRDTISHKTESMLNLLMIYTINTGLLTSIVSLLTLIMYVSHPHDYEFIAMYFILEKLYVNSLLASLNARDWLNGDSGVVSIPLSLLGTSDTQPSHVNHQTEALNLEASLTSIASGVRVHMEKTKTVI